MKTGLKQAMSARYFIGVRNFGDRITPFLIEKISHKMPYYERLDQPHLLGCGSILSSATKNSIIWGSGFISKNSRRPDITCGRVRAVRGRLSLERLKKQYGWMEDVPLGDPGSLLPRVYPRRANAQYRFGVIPHYVDKAHPFLDFCKANGALIIDPQRDVTDVLDDIFQCDKIFSSSLHGLILSDAYGIKNRWIELSEKVIGNRFKFHDYYSSRLTSQVNPEIIESNFEVSEILEACVATKEKFDLDALYNAFPSDEACTRELARIYDASTFKKQSQLPVPVFLTVKKSAHKPSKLKKLVLSLSQLDTPTTLVIHNCMRYSSGSLDYLNDISGDYDSLDIEPNTRVFVADTDTLSRTIDQFFEQYSEPTSYVVTCVDASIGKGVRKLLELSQAILDNFHVMNSVGCAQKLIFLSSPARQKKWLKQAICLLRSLGHVRNYYLGKHRIKYITNPPFQPEFSVYRAGYRFQEQDSNTPSTIVVLSSKIAHTYG